MNTILRSNVSDKKKKESFSIWGQRYNINKNDRENLADSRIESH